MDQSPESYRQRRRLGASIAELPFVLLVIFIFLFFPLLNLTTATVRTWFLRSAVLDAAHNAAKACTYGTHLPATANNTLTRFIQTFAGVSMTSSQVYVVRQAIAGGAATTYPPGPIAKSEIQPDANVYFIEVAFKGQAQPFLTVPFFSNVPGLGGPMPVNITGRETFENVEGLAQ
jgi:hypothetical protein